MKTNLFAGSLVLFFLYLIYPPLSFINRATALHKTTETILVPEKTEIIEYEQTTAPTDYFESNANGNWNDVTSWKSSSVSSSGPWTIPATSIPSGTARGIVILHTITLNSNESATLLTIDSGGRLIHTNGAVFTLMDDGTATADFIIANNGLYELHATQPVYATGSTVEVMNGGFVRARTNSPGGESDDFPRENDVHFQTGAVMEWNTSQPFQTSNVVYFPTATSTDHPVFRITATPSSALGSNNPTTFNGKFEVAAGLTFTFHNRGDKIFRDGLGGDGTLIHRSDTTRPCGSFVITGDAAVIDGNLNLVLRDVPDVDELEIASGAFVTVSCPNIHVGNAAKPGSNLLINGTISIAAGVSIDLENGNLELNGNIDASSTGTFKAGNELTDTVDVIIGGSNGNAGVLSFEPTANFVDTFIMDRTGTATPRIIMGSDMTANVFELISGKIVTGQHLISWNNAGDAVTGNASSYFATCTVTDAADEIGTPLTFSFPYDGSIGFRIMHVNNDLNIYFPVGPNLVRANKVFLKNGSTLDNNPFTISVAIGDIGNTPLPRVNRIWYIHEASPGTSSADMRLYFTKFSNTSGFPLTEDEVEFGFDYGDCHLIQETYVNQFINNSNGADIMNHVGAPDSSEIYAQYTRGISYGLDGDNNGIDSFTRFSIVNAQGIILPVHTLLLQAEKNGPFVQLSWKALPEADFRDFVIERSVDGKNFYTIDIQGIPNNTGSGGLYFFTDSIPMPGVNFYRIKGNTISSSIIYSGIKYVYIEKEKPVLKVFPNPLPPGMEAVNIELNNIDPGLYQVYIMDLVGNIVLRESVECIHATLAKQIRLRMQLAKGIYFLQVQNAKEKWSCPLIVP